MKAIIIDDEIIAIELLNRILLSYKDIQVVGSYVDPVRALGEIKKVQPDVIFLDIEMGELNGLEFAEVLIAELDTVEIVFVTAYSQYAVEAFEVNAIDYLLKPVLEKRMEKTLHRLRDKVKKGTKKNGEFEVNSFGSFCVLDAGKELLLWRTQKAKELFAFLWINKGRSVPSSLIMENIFPERDPGRARTLLHTTIYQLRKSLEKLGYPRGIIYKNEGYHLALPLTSDRDELDLILNAKEYGNDAVRKVLRIYKGDICGEEGYFWAVALQQGYKVMVIGFLMDYVKKQLMASASNVLLKSCLDKLYDMDPFNEKVAEMIIRYYGTRRNRGSLEKFFISFIENLQQELGLEPMQSTIELYKKYMNLQ